MMEDALEKAVVPALQVARRHRRLAFIERYLQKTV